MLRKKTPNELALDDHLIERGITRRQACAELGWSYAHFYTAFRYTHKCTPQAALQIEEWSKGKLKKEMLCPTIFK